MRPRPALVRRLGRRDLPELNLIADERPGAHHRLRRRPHLPHGPAPDGRAAHRARRGRDRRRAARADRAGRPVRRDRDGRRRARRSPPSARSRRTPSACPTRPTRSSPRWATTSSSTEALIDTVSADAADETLQARHRRQHHPGAGRAGRRAGLRLLDQRGAGRDRARPRLLARRRDARRLLRRAHGPDLGPPDLQPLQPRLADPHLARIRCRRPSSSSTRTAAAARRWTRWSAPASSSPAAPCAARSSRRGAHLHSYAQVEDSILMHGVEVGRNAVVRRAIVDKNVLHRRGRARSASTP